MTSENQIIFTFYSGSVEPVLMGTSIIWTPLYCGQFSWLKTNHYLYNTDISIIWVLGFRGQSQRAKYTFQIRTPLY